MTSLVITFALKRECPIDYFRQRKIPIFTLNALKAGEIHRATNKSVLVIITGVGESNAIESATIIRKELSPTLVLNLGSAGVHKPKDPSNFNELATPYLISEIQNGTISETQNTLSTNEREKISPLQNGLELPSSLKTATLSSGSGNCSSDLIDMEAFFLASELDKSQIPFLCIKISSDRNDENTDNDFISHLGHIPVECERLLNTMLIEPDTIKVSTIIPCHNRASFVESALKSAMDQDYPNHEIIVVDDGSTDNTQNLLAQLVKENRPQHDIKIITLEQNNGVSYARNRGVEYASGNIIALLDSDDTWSSTKLSRQIDYLSHAPFLTILQSQERWFRNGQEIGQKIYHQKKEGWIFNDCLERCLISPSSVLFRKSIFRQLSGFNETLPACEDYALWLFWAFNYPVGLCNDISLHKTGGHPQLSQQFSRMDHFRVIALITFLDKTFGTLTPYPEPLVPNPKNDTQNKRVFEKTLEVLQRKLTVLLTGCQKRGKTELVTLYSNLKKASNLDELKRLMKSAYKYNPLGYQ